MLVNKNVLTNCQGDVFIMFALGCVQFTPYFTETVIALCFKTPIFLLFTALILELLEFPWGILKTPQHYRLLLHICHLVAKAKNCRLTPSL